MPISERDNSASDQLRHRVIFADRESITPNENDTEIKQQWIEIYNENRNEGAVQSDGTISWDCPCLGTQAIGPCSQQFRAAFLCYQSSVQEPKGTDCSREFISMQQCFSKYPTLYGNTHQSDQAHHRESTIGSQTEAMGHPEARRQRLKEERRK